jgi:DNA polymerase III delta prime subunit
VRKFSNYSWNQSTSTTSAISSSRARPGSSSSSKPSESIYSTSSSRSSISRAHISTKRGAKQGQLERGDGLWIDKYFPRAKQELAIYVKRIQIVEEWLRRSYPSTLPSRAAGTRQAGLSVGRGAAARAGARTGTELGGGAEEEGGGGRLLCLVGPPGCGKTALIRVLAAELKLEISEWLNPTTCLWKDSEDKVQVEYSPIMEEFRRFMTRTDRYPSLLCGREQERRNKLVLLEDLPFLGQAQPRLQFQEVLRSYLNSTSWVFPVVLILSDDTLGNSSLSRLLSPDLLAHPNVTQIRLGAIAPTKLTKVLTAIAQAEGVAGHADAATVTAIVEKTAGDLRSAINALQFYTTKHSAPSRPSWKQPLPRLPASATANRCAKTLHQTPLQNTNIQDFGFRDVSLSLFHALGKVLHNKRLPLNQGEERGATKYDPEAVFEQASIDANLFNSFLHENYLLFFGQIEDVENVTSYFIDADTLLQNWQEAEHFSRYAASISARGIMYTNLKPCPKKYQSLFKPRQKAAALSAEENTYLAHAHFQIVPDDQNIRLESHNALLLDVIPFLHRMRRATPPFPPSPPPLPLYCSLTQAQAGLVNLLCTYSRDGEISAETLREHDEPDLDISTVEEIEPTCKLSPSSQSIEDVPHDNNSSVAFQLLLDDDIVEE